MRLTDQPRPFVWWAMQPFSRRYRLAHEARALPDWQRILLRRIVLVPRLKLLYVFNAKAASSSLRDMMFTLGGGGRGRGAGEGVCFPTSRWPEAIAALSDPSVYKFTVARDPATRAESAFSNLFVHRNNGFELRHIPYLGRTGLKFGDASSENFDRFLDYVEEVQAESELYCDVHLRLQTHNLGLRHLSYNRIGHYESLLDDVRLVMAEAGVTAFDESALGWANKAKEPLQRQLTAAQRQRIGRIYAEDYERLGYPVP